VAVQPPLPSPQRKSEQSRSASKTFTVCPLTHDTKSAEWYYPTIFAPTFKMPFGHVTQKLPSTIQLRISAILSILFRAGFLSSITRGTIDAPSPADFHEVGEREQRIWAELKYRDDRPVLQHMELISKPSKRIMVDIKEIRLLCSGRSAGEVKPLGFGEVAVVHTKNNEHEWLEAREALQMKLSGEMICRAR
jgi:ribosomal protein S8